MGEMKAKFGGTCRVCNESFPAGSRILWTRDEGARHVPAECGTAPEAVVDPTQPRQMNAAFPGRCKNCREPIQVGDPILHLKTVGAFHADCEPIAAPEPERVYAGGDVVTGPVERAVPDGHYTVMLGRPEDRVYVRLRPGFDEGQQIVQLDMPEPLRRDLEDAIRWTGRWVGIGTVSGTDLRLWRRFDGRVPAQYTQALTALLTGDRWTEFGEAFAEEFQLCYRCGSDLSAPASLCRGVGPTCAKYLGIEVDKQAVEAWMREHPVADVAEAQVESDDEADARWRDEMQAEYDAAWPELFDPMEAR